MDVLETLLGAGITAVLPAPLPLHNLNTIADALLATPIQAVEVPLADPQCHAIIRNLRERARENMLVGIGGVHEVADVQPAVDAGAQFLVAYNFNRAIQAKCTAHGILHIPSVISLFATRAALQMGCSLVRLVTHGVAGADYLSTIKQTLPDDVAHIAVAGDIPTELVTNYKEAGAALLMIDAGIVRDGEQKMGEIITNGRHLLHAWNPDFIPELENWRIDK